MAFLIFFLAFAPFIVMSNIRFIPNNNGQKLINKVNSIFSSAIDLFLF